MSFIELRNLRRVFVRGGSQEPPRSGVVDVSLSVEEGELMVIVGPSGGGKTTLLRLIAGLDPPDAGEVILAGKDISRALPHDRGVAFVFQDLRLYPHLTVEENLSFALRSRKVSRPLIAASVRDFSERLQIGGLLKRFPHQLSGGQQQRVAIGRALIGCREGPGVLLFDEPLAQLDVPLRGILREEILRLQRSLGRTMLYVTHDQEEAFFMADRLAFMDQGRLLQVGTPQELYQSPNNIQVAKFLGNPGMNVLTGKQTSANQIEIHGEPYTLPSLLTNTVGKNVIIGIRPEELHHRQGQNGEWQFSVIAERLQFRGYDWIFHGRLGGDPIRTLLPLDAPKPRPNEVLSLACSPNAARFFFESLKVEA